MPDAALTHATRACLAALLAATLAATSARAEDEPLLEDPVGLLGPAPTPVGGYTVTLGGGYARARNGPNRDTFGGSLESEAGILPGLDLRFSQGLGYGNAAPYPLDAAQRVWGGSTALGLRWQFLEEDDGLRPALGVFGAVSTDYGETSRPSQAGLAQALLSKTLIGGARPVALYLNAGWSELFSPQPGERAGRYAFAAGVAHSLALNTSVALSYSLSQQDRGERDEKIVSAGLWHRLAPGGPILGLGLGAGIGRDSPSVQAGVTLKWLLGAAD
jgi:hypothetical protein